MGKKTASTGEDTLEQVLRETDDEYGPLTEEELAWADEQSDRLLLRRRPA